MALHLRDRSEHAGPTLQTYRPTIIPGPRVRDGKNGERGTRTLRYRSPAGAVPLGVLTGYAKLGVTLGNHKAKTEQRPRADLIPGRTPTQRAGLGSLAPHRPLDASHLTSAPPLRLELRALVESDRRPYLDAVCASRQALDRWAPLHRTGESDDELFDRQIALARAGETHANAFRRVGWFEGRIAGGFNLSTITRGLQFEADVNWWVRSDLTRMGLGQEGLRALLDVAFEPLPQGLGLQRVLAAIRPDNLWSVRLAERVGFQRLGDQKGSMLVGGRWEPHDVYARVP